MALAGVLGAVLASVLLATGAAGAAGDDRVGPGAALGTAATFPRDSSTHSPSPVTIATTPGASRPQATEAGNPAAPEPGRGTAAQARGLQKQARVQRERVAWGQIALLAVTCAVLVDRARRRPRLCAVARRCLLGGLAIAAVGSYFADDAFDGSPGQLHLKDVYHYWMGTRYFDELGYDGLYDCTLAVAVERGSRWVGGLGHARDLRTNEIRPVAELAARGRVECPARFSPARWQAFAHDVAWFEGVLGPRRWRGLLNDHGYNPSPVWALCARPFAAWTDPASVVWLARLDGVLLAAALTAIAWAFGLETALVATIVWGTGWLWDARWVGNAFMRQVWFATSTLAVCCMKQGWGARGGVLAALAATTRLFPGLMVLGWAATLRRGANGRAPDATITGRALAGFAVASIVLVGASLLAWDHGPGRWWDFAQNLSALRSMPSVNLVGLEPLLWRFDGTSQLWQQGAAALPAVRVGASPVSSVIRLVVSFGALALAWRAVRRARPWEAGVIALFLVPILAAPAGYYMQLAVLGVLLGVRRPKMAIAVVAACIGWSTSGVVAGSAIAEFGIASGIALALSFFVLVGGREALESSAAGTASTAASPPSAAVPQSGAQRNRSPAAPE
jgi:hypothetical protein